MAPKVSVNLPCYNGEKYLAETLDAVGAQTFKDWELVVVNDGSKDGTEGIVQSYVRKDWPIRYHYQENQGLANARNQCLALSSGELIAFVDQDDLWLPRKLELQVRLFDGNPRVALTYGDCEAFFQGTNRTFRYFQRFPPSRGRIFREQLRTYNMNISTVMARRSVLEDLGGFDPQFKLAEEADVFLRLLERHEADFVPEVVGRARLHEGSATRLNGDRFAVEQECVLGKLAAAIPGFERDYAAEAAYFRGKIALTRSIAAIRRGDGPAARAALRPHLAQDWHFLVVYLTSYFPAGVYHFLHSVYRSSSL